MSGSVQLSTFNDLNSVIAEICGEPEQQLTAETVQAAKSRGEPSISVARYRGENLTLLSIVLEHENTTSAIQLHKIGWYVTASALLIDGKDKSLGYISDLELEIVRDLVKEQHEEGAFRPSLPTRFRDWLATF